jgi:hypothetical protein
MNSENISILKNGESYNILLHEIPINSMQRRPQFELPKFTAKRFSR